MQRYDEKMFLDLLQEYKSEDSRKARRNLSVTSFVVISAWLLGIKVNELKILGIDLSQSSELSVLLLGLVLIGYWALMFSLAWRHDQEIQKERTVALNTTVSQLQERLTLIEQLILERQTKGIGIVPDDYEDVKAAVKAYERQQSRTEKATQIGQRISKLEHQVPGALAFASSSILVAGILRWF